MRTPSLVPPEPEAKVLAFVPPAGHLSDDEIASLRLAVRAQVRRVINHLVAHPEAWDASVTELAALSKEAGRCA
jgi:hypothetical protein